MLGQAGYSRAAAAGVAVCAVSLVFGVAPAAPQGGALEVDAPPVALPLQVPPLDVPSLRLPALELPPLQTPIEQPSPVRPDPQGPSQAGSTSTVANAAGIAPAATPRAGANTPRAGETPGANRRRPAGRESVPRPPSARDRSEGNRPGARDANAPANPGPTLSDRVGDVIGGVPWQLTVTIGVLAILALLMAGRSALSAARAGRLARQRTELRFDVGALQSALLPAVPDDMDDVRLSVAYRPAEGPAAGGDFYDVVQLDKGRVGLVVGDVSGHGREALAVTALVHYTVRAYLAVGLQPRVALRLTDQALAGKLGDDFATLLVAIYNPALSTLEYATAGHPVPLVVGQEQGPTVDALTPPPIGIGPRTGTRETCVSIASGSRICLFTDGLTEARDEHDALLNREGLNRILGERGEGLDADSLLAELIDRTTAGGDDLTACLLEPLDASGDGTVTEVLEIDPDFEATEDLHDFLDQCGLDPDGVEDALAQIRLQAGLGDPMVLRVTRLAGAADWEIARVSAAATPPLAAALA